MVVPLKCVFCFRNISQSSPRLQTNVHSSKSYKNNKFISQFSWKIETLLSDNTLLKIVPLFSLAPLPWITPSHFLWHCFYTLMQSCYIYFLPGSHKVFAKMLWWWKSLSTLLWRRWSTSKILGFDNALNSSCTKSPCCWMIDWNVTLLKQRNSFPWPQDISLNPLVEIRGSSLQFQFGVMNLFSAESF